VNSHRWLLLGVAAVGPLTLHYLVFAMLTGVIPQGFAVFDQWILMSAALTAHVHAYFVWASWRFASLRSDEIVERSNRIVLDCIYLSAVPAIVAMVWSQSLAGIVYIAIMPFVGVTAFALVRGIHMRVARRIAYERDIDNWVASKASVNAAFYAG